jgi:hypothetical protein
MQHVAARTIMPKCKAGVHAVSHGYPEHELRKQCFACDGCNPECMCYIMHTFSAGRQCTQCIKVPLISWHDLVSLRKRARSSQYGTTRVGGPRLSLTQACKLLPTESDVKLNHRSSLPEFSQMIYQENCMSTLVCFDFDSLPTSTLLHI